MPADGPFYREPDPDLSQGDILEDVPHLRLGPPPILALREVDLKKGRKALGYYPYPPVPGQTPDAPGKTVQGGAFHFKSHEGENVSAVCHITRAMLLNYDCDLQPGRENHCLVGLVRSLHGVQPEHRDFVRQGRNFHSFYLPADERFGLEEAFVDFRRVTCLDPEVLDIGRRLVSLTPAGLTDLQAHLFRFLTRRDLVIQSPDTTPQSAQP